ncbi:MAG: type III secretion system cytoplasmic ring protein SctQ [Chlamydiales bacterium]
MTAPLAWVRRVASELPDFNTIPLFGNAPPFDWVRFASSLAAQFGLPRFAVNAKGQQWREGSELKQGLGSQVRLLPVTLSPLGTVYWMMAEADVLKLVSWIMKPSSKSRTPISEILQEGFYRYLALEALHSIQGTEPFTNLTLQLAEEEDLQMSKAFCIDVEIQFDQKSCWARLALPVEFRANWIQHFSAMASEYFPTELSRKIEIDLSVKIGSVLLRREEWEAIQPGDFILLDQGSYDAQKRSGASLLMLRSTPLFNVKIERDRLALTDYAFHYEDTMEPEKKTGDASQEEEVVALKELPLSITVEIARLKMTLDQLMHLTPGNTLDLPIHPDQGVSLTMNGQKIGRAELVYLGEQLGIRILEI